MNSQISTQASNFGDALQTHVDPRTGQFTVNFPIATLNGNNKKGPELALALRYFSLNSYNEGFGNGYTIGLTQFNRRANLLQLSSGEQYRVDPGSDIVQYQKLNNFRFAYTNGRDDREGYTVSWKEGKIEHLTRMDDDRYVPTTIKSPLGRKLSLEWNWSGQLSRLSKITDENNTILCNIIYSSTYATTVSIWPNSKENYEVEFTFINNGQLDTISRQNSAAGNAKSEWRFKYQALSNADQQIALKSIDYPTGMKDEVIYNTQNLLRFPDQSNLDNGVAAVETHTRYLGNDQPHVISKYKYSDSNFLGYNSGLIGWSANSDSLYQISTGYTYGSTETVFCDGKEVTTERKYNKFHLLVSEEIIRENCSKCTEYSYYANTNDPFKLQPAQYQLLKEQKTIYKDLLTGQARNLVTKTEFDTSGNPTLQIDSNGKETRTIWYPAEGDEHNCPADPNGFVRFIKERKIIPRYVTELEKERCAKYTYKKLGNTECVAQDTETCYHGDVMLYQHCTKYNCDEDHDEIGRINEITDTVYDLSDSSKAYTTTKAITTTVNDGKMTQNINTTGHDGITTTCTRCQSTLNDHVYSDTSTEGIETQYEYDVLGRLIKRTLCPNSNEHTHTTTWEYGIDSQGKPYTIEIGPVKNKCKTYFDAAGRQISKHAYSADASDWFEMSLNSNNSLGEIISSTVNDWVPGNSDQTNKFPLQSNITYDGWGQKKTVDFSNGKKQNLQTDFIQLTRATYEQGGTGRKRLIGGSVMDEYDTISENRISKTLKNASGEVYSRCKFQWDGLGQLYEEQDELGAITKRVYDEYGRVITQTLPDNTIVTRTYAPHLTGKQITSVSVTGKNASGQIQTWLLGTQTFDSLGRIKERVSGGRTTSYTYQSSAPKPSAVTLPSGKVLNYTYIPELNYEISSMTTDDITQNFTYDKATGKLLSATDSPSEIQYTWSKDGHLTEETFKYDGIVKKAKCSQSLNNATTSYTDVTGKETKYTMNTHGSSNRRTTLPIIEKLFSIDRLCCCFSRAIALIACIDSAKACMDSARTAATAATAATTTLQQHTFGRFRA